MTVDDDLLAALDAPASAPSWPGGGRIAAERRLVTSARQPEPQRATDTPFPLEPGFRKALGAAGAALRASEAELADLDGRAGDGDLGASMVRAAEAIGTVTTGSWSSPSAMLAALGEALRKAIGGSSGPFYAAALLRGARRLGEAPEPIPAEWAAAFGEAVAAIEQMGGAKPGDRTMLDALRPAADAFHAAISAGRGPVSAWRAASEAAEAGAEATAHMQPRLGRASYLGERALGIPDAGASAVVVWKRAIANALD